MFEQERVIGRLQRRVAAVPSLLACFLSGSYGRRAEDDYADLDVALVFSSESQRDIAWNERHEFAQSVMPYVPIKAFDAEHIRPYFYVTLFANGSKVDYRYEVAPDLSPDPWDGQIRILKDTDKWAEKYQITSSQMSKAQPAISSSELSLLDQRFWVMYWDVLRLLARGDSDKPFTIYLELLSFTLPPLLRILPSDDPAHQRLLNAIYNRDIASTLQHLSELLDAYLEARSTIVKKNHLQFVVDQSFESEIQRLVQRLT